MYMGVPAVGLSFSALLPLRTGTGWFPDDFNMPALTDRHGRRPPWVS